MGDIRIPSLVHEFDYPEAGARLVAERLARADPRVWKAFRIWWDTGMLPELSIAGQTVQTLMTAHGMNPIAALLKLDWLVREPGQALMSLAREHDRVRKRAAP